MRATLTALVLAAAFTVTPAHAQDFDHDGPPPATAKRMTQQLADWVTWWRARAERFDTDRWPDGARITVNHDDCKIKDRRHGSCTYDIDTFGDAGHKACSRRVFVRITKRTHRVKSRVKSLGCKTT